jgi:hypothetical protein
MEKFGCGMGAGHINRNSVGRRREEGRKEEEGGEEDYAN